MGKMACRRERKARTVSKGALCTVLAIALLPILADTRLVIHHPSCLVCASSSLPPSSTCAAAAATTTSTAHRRLCRRGTLSSLEGGCVEFARRDRLAVAQAFAKCSPVAVARIPMSAHLDHVPLHDEAWVRNLGRDVDVAAHAASHMHRTQPTQARKSQRVACLVEREQVAPPGCKHSC